MKKISCVVSCPIDTYSGYGGRSRDFVKALVKVRPDWDVKILSQRWGNTRQGFLQDHNDTLLLPLVINNLTYKPDVWVQITIPNEFVKIGTFNVGVTAGVETTLADASWIQGGNNMDLILVSSNFSKQALQDPVYEMIDNTTKESKGHIKLQTPMEVLFEGINTDVYKKIDEKENTFNLSSIHEEFCFLSIGHWIQGSFGHDRKNLGYTVKSFLETFKNMERQPALIMKVSHANSSIIDRDKILDKINDIRKTVKGNLPNIYLIHGDLSDDQVNELYNHPKVKCMLSLTKGEGYGRPLAEFSVTGKPIVASNWSGHLDFLFKDFNILINGTLENVHESAVTDKIVLKEAKWFKPDDENVGTSLRSIYKEYRNYLGRSSKQAEYIENNFTFKHMAEKLNNILENRTPNIPQQVELKLPQLSLPKLKKLE
jgi:glycosyltransferase involved in cell wall biosynthesis